MRNSILIPMKTQNKTLYVLFLSSVAAIGGFLFGYDSAVINGTVSALQQAFKSSAATSGFSVASMLLGCAVGAIVSGIATGVPEFIVYRLVGGFAVGAASVLAPTYIAEVAPSEIRGRLASLQQLAIVVGIFSAFLVNYAIASIAGGASVQ